MVPRRRSELDCFFDVAVVKVALYLVGRERLGEADHLLKFHAIQSFDALPLFNESCYQACRVR